MVRSGNDLLAGLVDLRMLQGLQLGLEAVEFFLQVGQLLQHGLLRGASRLQTDLAGAASQKRRAVQLQALDVERTGLGEADQSPILGERKMAGQVIFERVEQPLRRVWLPVIALEFVARVTAVDEIAGRVRAASRARLEVIHSQ